MEGLGAALFKVGVAVILAGGAVLVGLGYGAYRLGRHFGWW